MKKLVIARRLSQGFFLALFIYILWSTTYPLTGLFSPALLFNLDPLLVLMTAISERVVIPGLVASLAMLGLTCIAGRFFCGWVCPLGTAIDMAGALKKRPRRLSERQNRLVRKVKFIALGLIAAGAILGRQIAWVMDPIALAARFVSLNLIPTITLLLNNVFIFFIRDVGLGGAFRDLYRDLKPTILGVKTTYFANAPVIAVYFLIVVATALLLPRLWCRALCPLGALYALCARVAPLGRVVEACKQCGRCSSRCRTGAIGDDVIRYDKGECILCMDCVYMCPTRGVSFRFGPPPAQSANKDGIGRKEFLTLLFSSAGLISLLGFRSQEKTEKRPRVNIIRPPAALPEKEFVDRCVRCGNCMKVCITNGLQPLTGKGGYNALWTPQLVPEIGYCEYSCTLCGDTCPTGAIRKITLEEKKKTCLGLARIDRSLCIPYAEGRECIVCQEHCPVADKAIKLVTDKTTGVRRPVINEELCVGCGICQNKCPIRPVRAIRVENAVRLT